MSESAGAISLAQPGLRIRLFPGIVAEIHRNVRLAVAVRGS
jgi:hypothetical protein